jgi:hypothetical protein
MKRAPTGNLWMTAPIPEIVDRLVKKGFAKWAQKKWYPLPIGDLTPLPVKDLILRYRVIMYGFLNYYSESAGSLVARLPLCGQPT